MLEAGARVQKDPNVVNNLPMSPHDIKIETVGVLALEVSQERLAESRRLYHATHSVTLEEGVELRDRPVKGLCGSSAFQFKVHLFWVCGARGAADERCELLGMEGSVLNGTIGKSGKGGREGNRLIRGHTHSLDTSTQ